MRIYHLKGEKIGSQNDQRIREVERMGTSKINLPPCCLLGQEDALGFGDCVILKLRKLSRRGKGPVHILLGSESRRD
jgi:hypothetical protein